MRANYRCINTCVKHHHQPAAAAAAAVDSVNIALSLTVPNAVSVVAVIDYDNAAASESTDLQSQARGLIESTSL